MSTTDTCDQCGKTAELYYNEETELSLCSACDLAAGAAPELTSDEWKEILSALTYKIGKLRGFQSDDGSVEAYAARLQKLVDRLAP